jgi:phage FluMu protein Com
MAGTRTRLQCNECGKIFTRSIGKNTYEMKCPGCGGYDTEPIGLSGLI